MKTKRNQCVNLAFLIALIDNTHLPVSVRTGTLFVAYNQVGIFIGGNMNPQTHLVNFHRKKIISFSDGVRQFIALKPVCENIGLQWEAQYHRLKRDEKFNSTMSVMDMVAEDGRSREMVCLPLEVFPGWLYTIQANRIRNKRTRAMIQTYQREATRVLYEHFMPVPRQLQEDHAKLQNEIDLLKANYITAFITEKRDEIFLSKMRIFYQAQWIWRLKIHCKGKMEDVTDITGMFVSTLKPYIRRYEAYLSETRNLHLLDSDSRYDAYTAAKLAPAFRHAGFNFWKMFYRNDPLLWKPGKIINAYEADRHNKAIKLGAY